MIVETKKVKKTPPPRCNLSDISHSSECCDRDPHCDKAVIYSHEQRHANGICLDWNKRKWDAIDLCKFEHSEIEACRYSNFCSRMNCKIWHDIPGKFPFLGEMRMPRRNC